uniref:Putative sugar transporter ERD6-like 8 n=1 Tax=Davidia involucrata TaxID=16924 RepID=A0A5B6ZBN6_DAVIN
MASIDMDNDHGKISEPLIGQKKEEHEVQNNKSGLWNVFLSTFVAVCGSYAFGSCVGYSAPAQYQIMSELNLSYSQYSVFGSILNIGAMLGAVTCGRIADYSGRKGAMWLSSIICIIGWFAIYWSSGPVLLDFGRFLTGYAIGIVSYVVPVYIGEITPVHLRGALASSNQLLIVIGLSLAYVIGEFVTWRTLALTGMIPCVFLFVGLFFVPESPRWLAMNGQQKEFEAALQKLRGPDADISQEATMIQEYLETLRGLPKVSLLNLFDKSTIRPVFVAVGLMAFQQFVGINGIVFYSKKIFISAGFDPSVGSVVYACLQVVVTAIGASIIDKAGRRPLLLISASGLLLGSLLVALSFLLKAHHLATDATPILAVTGVLVYIAAFSVGMGAGPWLIMSEVFPLHIKGMGGGLVTLMNWFGSWVVSYTFNFLMLWSSSGTFFLDASVCVLAIIFIYMFVPETKGRSLEEIQASMNS